VQVYYPGVGWVDSDPTGTQVAAAANDKSLRQRIGAALSKLWHAIPGGRLGAILIVIALAVLVIAGIFGLRRWRSRRRERRLLRARLAGAGPALAAYLRLEAVLSRDERSREPAETLSEFACRLGGIVVPPSEVARAVRVVEAECYARESRRPSAGESLEAAAVFDRLRVAADSQSVTLSRAAATAVANRSGAPGS